jgi:hypothetical protein
LDAAGWGAAGLGAAGVERELELSGAAV